VTYSFGPEPTVDAGYYLFTAVFSGFATGTSETLGVVTTDIAHNNFVLSEGQTGSFSIPVGGQSAVPPLQLQPVVANVFVPTPTVVPATLLGAIVGSFETTVFATDEMGYVIPSSTGTIDNLPATPAITISATTPANLTFKIFGTAGAYTPALNTATSITALPSAGIPAGTTALKNAGFVAFGSGAAADYPSVTGTLLLNILTSSAFSLATNGATLNGDGTVHGIATNSAGNPVNITCATSSSSVAWNAVLTSLTPTGPTVTGYPLTPGANYPLTSNTIPLTPVNCSPGFTVPIN
jgi:hypothetical protein